MASPTQTLPRILLLLALSAMVGFGVYHWAFASRKAQIDEAHNHPSAIEWFCAEFGVSPEQRKKIDALHTAHYPGCADHCVHYADTKETLDHIHDSPGSESSPAHEEAARELAALEAEADENFITFIGAVAAELDEDQAARYRSRMAKWTGRKESPPEE